MGVKSVAIMNVKKMKKYNDYTKEELIKVIENKNKTIASLNGKVWYYKSMFIYKKDQLTKYKQRAKIDLLDKEV